MRVEDPLGHPARTRRVDEERRLLGEGVRVVPLVCRSLGPRKPLADLLGEHAPDGGRDVELGAYRDGLGAAVGEDERHLLRGELGGRGHGDDACSQRAEEQQGVVARVAHPQHQPLAGGQAELEQSCRTGGYRSVELGVRPLLGAGEGVDMVVDDDQAHPVRPARRTGAHAVPGHVEVHRRLRHPRRGGSNRQLLPHRPTVSPSSAFPWVEV